MKQIRVPDVITMDRTARIRDILKQEGACCVGFADVSSLGLQMTREYPFGICFAIRFDDSAVNELPYDEPWRQVSSSLAGKARQIYRAVESFIELRGYHHRRVASGVNSDNLQDLREQLPVKTLATLSGVGWVGKSTLLISPEFGHRIRISALLTDMPLNVDTPITQSQCNNCRACVDVCPVNAIRGNQWSQMTSRDELIDVLRCNDYLWSAKSTLGRKEVCGVCLKTCPVGLSGNEEIGAPISQAK